jgi:chemotaxis protein methyltransferase CheR
MSGLDTATGANLKDDELRQLLLHIQKNHNYDFTRYAIPSLKRRIERILTIYEINTVQEIIRRLGEDSFFFSRFLTEVTVGVTEMFRDPQVWELMRDEVLPFLSRLPEIKIWHAGCSTGEEVFSMAIMLKEAGLLHKTQLMATDINLNSLEVARQGVYSHRKIELYERNYLAYQGKESFLDYFKTVNENFGVIDELKERVTFVHHNLVSGEAPGSFNLIVCRNVLIYFDQELQDVVLQKFMDSLSKGGYLVLGNYESLIWCSGVDKFDIVSKYFNVMQKVTG